MEDKLYYSIKEVSEELNVSYPTLRYWEDEFKELKPFHNKRGVRMYSKENIEVIKNIIYLTKQCGYTIDGAKNWFKEKKFASKGDMDVLETLLETKKFLLRLKEGLNESAKQEQNKR
jgi:DNA-binding transcriptional MerR regulator